MGRRPPQKGLLFVISGPSGSGKTTLLEKLVKKQGLNHKLFRSISMTTRPKRSLERNGRDYYFVTPGEFRNKLRAKKVLEYTRYLGYYYATRKDVIARNLARGKSALLCLDVKGAASVRRAYPHQTITIFVMPPSLKTLWERIRKRCHKTGKEEIDKRLQLAEKELAAAGSYDYCILNKDLKQAVNALGRIVASEMQDRFRSSAIDKKVRGGTKAARRGDLCRMCR